MYCLFSNSHLTLMIDSVFVLGFQGFSWSLSCKDYGYQNRNLVFFLYVIIYSLLQSIHLDYYVYRRFVVVFSKMSHYLIWAFLSMIIWAHELSLENDLAFSIFCISVFCAILEVELSHMKAWIYFINCFGRSVNNTWCVD